MTDIDEAKARLRGSLMDYGPRAEDDDIRTVLDALDAAEKGLYDVYVNLGEDTDGARNARELFGPMVSTTPGELVPRLVAAYRSEMEAESERFERERDEAIHARMVERRDSNVTYQERNELAAVIERAKAAGSVSEWDIPPTVKHILDSVPSDVLRERDAETIRRAARFLRSSENPERGSDFRRESYVMDDAGDQLFQYADRIKAKEQNR